MNMRCILYTALLALLAPAVPMPVEPRRHMEAGVAANATNCHYSQLPQSAAGAVKQATSARGVQVVEGRRAFTSFALSPRRHVTCHISKALGHSTY